MSPSSSSSGPTGPVAVALGPILVRVWRGPAVESQHSARWVLADVDGRIVAGAGDPHAPVFARSSLKSLQALPLLESGAAERCALTDEELALALASHDAEPRQVEIVRNLVGRLGLSVSDLRCGPQVPADRRTRAELASRGEPPGPLHNNCSGKHAGFLALAAHLGDAPASYLDPDGRAQSAVRAAVAEMCGVEPGALVAAIDGCNAPTYCVPLASLATAIARVANPDAFAPTRRAACERMAEAVARHPGLIAGEHRRLCTALARASGGRLFPKIGAEAVYVVGARGRGLGLAVKVDDGGDRALAPLVLALLERLGWLGAAELAALEPWRERVLTNRVGVPVGRTEVLV